VRKCRVSISTISIEQMSLSGLHDTPREEASVRSQQRDILRSFW
jgi:hypothetical protein